MIKQTIGIDLDGCIFDFSDNFNKAMLKYFNIVCLSKDNHLYRSEFMKYAEDYTEECFNLPLYQHSIEVIHKLNENYDVKFITKRGTKHPIKIKNKIQNITNKLLDNHFSFHKGCFFTDDKKTVAKEQSIVLMIEDEVENAVPVSDVCPVLLFNRPWNRNNTLNSNIIPIDNWKEAQHFISNNLLEKYQKIL